MNIFNAIPADLTDEVFEDIVRSDNVKIERIISKGHITPKDDWYDQQQNEWVIVLQGEAIINFTGKDAVTLKQGDYLNIPAHQKHRVTWTKPNSETIWLAVHY